MLTPPSPDKAEQQAGAAHSQEGRWGGTRGGGTRGGRTSGVPYLEDLRGHVVWGANHGARHILVVTQSLADAEVTQLHNAVC